MPKYLTLLLFLTALAACRSEPPADGTASAARSDGPAIETVHGSLNLSAPPQKTAVYDFALLDTLTALGIAPAAVPAKRFLPYLETAAQDIPTAGTVYEPDYEALARIAPDLILTGLANSKIRGNLAQIAPVADLPIDGSRLITGGLERLDQLGRLYGRSRQADELRTGIESRLAAARRAAAALGNAQGAVVMIHGSKLSVFGPDSYFGWIYREIGLHPLENGMPESGRAMPVTHEYFSRHRPEWLVVIDRNRAIGEQRTDSGVLDTPLLRQTPAFANRRIIYLSSAAFIAGGGVRQMQQDLDRLAEALSAP
ncbi:ABC transporter substrate-binding protein [Neisseria leonii]|uniref:ABC transporter substrate-binding protein n=1 Tax=Neisseria leonii TaxID=2995413 RepID=UPI00237C4380|nr:ABC transporter substrate-binding protein [Neisseria sp. 3986]MDD9325262.1 ABC transporter substrate-binding protein [Neisseria sp. 3986]